MLKHFKVTIPKEVVIHQHSFTKEEMNKLFNSYSDCSSSDWDEAQMKNFILFQNGYSYDGQEPVKHSVKALAQFAEIEGEQLAIFEQVYTKLYAKQ